MIKEYTAILNGKKTKRYIFATNKADALENLKEDLTLDFGGYDEIKITDNRIIATGNNTIFEGEETWTVKEAE